MHELSICSALIKQLEKVADEYNAVGFERIVLRIGPLSGVAAPLLQQAWSPASAGTIAADAELVIESVPVAIRCTKCEAVSEVTTSSLLCKSCGDGHTCLISGDELLLASIDLSVADPAVQNK